jgi:hypothetical protein
VGVWPLAGSAAGGGGAGTLRQAVRAAKRWQMADAGVSGNE